MENATKEQIIWFNAQWSLALLNFYICGHILSYGFSGTNSMCALFFYMCGCYVLKTIDSVTKMWGMNVG